MNDYYIRDIERKLSNGERLDGLEIKTVVAALRESKNCLQAPYYEVVYHDEYGKTESRIMNPIHQTSMGFVQSGYDIVEDRFEIDFKRIVPRREG